MPASTILKGINLSGLADRGQYYHASPHEQMDYFHSKGMNFIRIPIWWDRLQPNLHAPFDDTVWDQVKDMVAYGLSLGCTVMVNNHSMGARGAPGQEVRLGTPQVPYSALTDFWRRMAAEYKGQPDKVWFDLINEPAYLPLNGHVTSTDALVCIYNAAIAAIRAEGAKNLIVLEGNGYNNAMSFNVNPWYNPGGKPPTSGEAFLSGIADPENNWCVSCHNYPDNPHGDGGYAVDATILRTRFQNVMDWASANNRKVICGEWSVVADDPNGQAVTTDYLNWLDANQDKVLAWSWWQGRATAWDGGNFTIYSDAASEDPRWAWLQPYLT